MQNAFRRWACVLALVAGGCRFFALDAHAQATPDRVRNIRWYYLPLGAFVRYRIDSASIELHHALEGRVRHPTAFLQGVGRALKPHPAASNLAFGHGQVRMLFAITYADGRTECLQVDVTRTALWRRQLYRVDSTAEAVLLSVLSRKQQQRQRVGKYAIRRRHS